MSKAQDLLNGAKKGEVGDFDEHFQGGGRRSDYEVFRDEATKLDVGESFMLSDLVKESTVSSIRNCVYKSNPDDSDEKKYVVEMSKANGEKIDGKDAYHVRIYHNPHFYENGEAS